ncbi:MAG TPA: ATP-binding protein [Gammaproteobacteria bacterium]|jgi:signal transduction histidine kinase
MRIAEYWRTSTFRLVLLFGAVFLVAVVSLLGLIYWRTAGYMTQQMDLIISAESVQFVRGGPEKLPQVLETYQARDARHVNLYGLFSHDGRWITGNLTELPPGLAIDGKVHLLTDYERLSPGDQPARAMAVDLPWGETLVVGRDVTQLYGIRRIILYALLEGGFAITVLGLALGFALSLHPVRRAQAIRLACEQVVAGSLDTRLPVTRRRDELDFVAITVNTMLGKIERLLQEVKNVSDNVAHDLRTPMTHLRARLYRLKQQTAESRLDTSLVDELIEDTDAVLRRFKALLRLSEIEHGLRHQGFARTPLDRLVADVADLYAPLAEDQGKQLDLQIEAPLEMEVDPELMFEAISNILDNAIKFSPCGGTVRLRLSAAESSLEISDEGSGIAEQERSSVLNPYYRASNVGHPEGSGLGLSIVAAIVRLHGFTLQIGGSATGTHVRILMVPAQVIAS